MSEKINEKSMKTWNVSMQMVLKEDGFHPA